MSNRPEILGVYLSQTLDLDELYGEALRRCGGGVVLRHPEQIEDPGQVRFAICWLPAADAFAAYPNLSLAMSIGAGVDDLLAHPGLNPEIAIARVRDPHQAALMAGYVAHEVLHYERGFGPMAANASAGLWRAIPMRPPKDAVVAVLGHGTMGRAVVEALRVLGFSLRVACRRAPEQPLSGVAYLTGEEAVFEAAAGADYLINVLPLTAATDSILSAALFARLRPGARLIQIGRGEHLVEADLEAALGSGQLAGATLDVFRTEPLPEGHPYWRDERLRITPHVASDSMPEVVAQQVVATARALRDGAPLELGVDRRRGY